MQTNLRVLWITMQINSFCLSCSVRYMLAITVSAWAESYKNKRNTTTYPWIKLFLMLYSSFFGRYKTLFIFWVFTSPLSKFDCIKCDVSNICFKLLPLSWRGRDTGTHYGNQNDWTENIYCSNAFCSISYVYMNKYSFS